MSRRGPADETTTHGAWAWTWSGLGARPLRKATLRPFARFFRLHLTVPRRRVRVQRADKTIGRGRYFLHRAIERGFVGLRWLARAAELPDELKRRGTDFVVSRGRREVRERFDVSTHG